MDLFRQLFNGNGQELFVSIDGTYLFVEKPLDLELQKLLWSVQKGRPLVKMMMIGFSDGYIFDAVGPFCANPGNNDANIMKTLITGEGLLTTFAKPGDPFVVRMHNMNLFPTFLSC